MTVLQRTDLTTSQKIQCAAAAQDNMPTVKTALSETYEIAAHGGRRWGGGASQPF